MSRRQPAHPVFFPLAAGYAMLALPASLLAMQRAPTWLPGLTASTGHGHEMLFGFALAVAAGFLIHRIRPATLYALAALWIAARATYLALPGSIVAAVLNAGFAAGVAALAAPQFIRAAKKLRNRVFGPLLIGVALVVIGFHAANPLTDLPARVPRLMLHEGVLLFALMMFFMGGRIIAPAVAGALQRRGVHLEARVQPRLEGLVLALLLSAVVLAPWAPAAAGVAALGAGLGTALRVGRWRLWHLKARADLAGLGVGYAWLAAGLLLLGGSLLLDGLRPTTALHAITVGAIGSLSIGVMARTRLLWAKRDPSQAPGVPLALALVSAAALLRIAGPAWPDGVWGAYWGAALAWSLAYLLLLRLLLSTARTVP